MAELGKAFEVGEDAIDVAPFAVQRQLVGVAHDLGRDVGGQIFAQRRLGESELAGADRAGGGADRGIAEQPAERPAKGRARRSVDAMTLPPAGEGAEKGELREKGKLETSRRGE